MMAKFFLVWKGFQYNYNIALMYTKLTYIYELVLIQFWKISKDVAMVLGE